MPRLSLLMLVAQGCSDEGTDSTEPPPTGPTWYGEVEPVVRENCVSCHQAEGIGVPALDDYETARTWAGAMAQAVTDRTMPPWLLTDDGTCGDFADSRWLAEEDIALIDAWSEAGAPEGDAALAVSDPLPALPALDQVDVVLATPTFVPIADGTPFALSDEYRCFLLEEPVEQDTFLTGFEVRPGNAAMVHHVLGMPVDLDAPGWDGTPNREQIALLDGADDRDGWDCYGTAGDNVSIQSIPVVWAPGMGAVEFPEGVGIPMSTDRAMVLQVHYNLADPQVVGQSDQTRVLLRTAEQVERTAHVALSDAFLSSLLYGAPETIPPGEEAYTFTSARPVSEVLAQAGVPEDQLGQPFDLVAVMPHMHGMGRQERLEVLRGTDAPECLAEVLRWDFDWQLWYSHQQPVTLQPDDALQVSCTWDSRASTEPTLPGWGTTNEMCLVSLMLVRH